MPPLIYAHRGASFDFPEMSMAAYQAAVDQGADGFECDLRLTKDGVMVCWHDADMARIANSKKVISQSTYSEINAVYPIVTLEELLTLALKHKKNLALETKHPVPKGGLIENQLLAYLDSHKSEIAAQEIHIAIMSFSWRAVWRIRRQGWDSVYLTGHSFLARFSPGNALGPWIKILDGIRPKKDQKIFVWTVNEPEEALLCLRRNVDVIITDKPAFIRSTLKSA
jgi:glycerophosphoryl diester phosphodiesterase